MRKIIIIALSVFLLLGCATHKQIVVQSEQRDSARVEYRERTIYVPDTVVIEIPAQQAERITQDSVSKLENDYAFSVARINQDGTLFHNLLSKPQKKPVAIQAPVVTRDSLIYKYRVVKQHETEIKYVEKKLSWWQQTQIYGFWAAIIFLAIAYHRKIFDTLVRLFLKK